MRVSLAELQKAIEVLKRQENLTTDMLGLIGALQYIADEAHGNEINLIDRNAYFASILWCEEDIRAALKDEDIEPTDEAVSEILNRLSISGMEDCSDGWLHIYDAIDEYQKDLGIDKE